jgi:Protein of unknown function (DUF2580).
VSDGFGVDHSALDEHARRIDVLADGMRLAADAGRPLDLLSYGLVGQVFAAVAVSAVNTGAAAVGDLSRRIAELGDGVRATRDEYLHAEQRNCASLRAPR